MNFLLIDASYFVFYRYYALKTWWNFSKKPEESDCPCKSARFCDKYRSTFSDKINEITRKLYIKNPVKIVGRDCPKHNIWRNEYIDNYKGNRKNDNDVGEIFKITYNDDLFEKSGFFCLQHDKLEADDCIAIATKEILRRYSNAKIWIITSDMDYLQLAGDNVKLFNMQFKDLTQSKSCFKDPQKDLFCKIVSGDKSDNIKSVFPKCGIKTAEKYYHNPDKFKEKLSQNDEAIMRYNRNKKIIDFNEIPEQYQIETLSLFCKLFN
jgi:5'-3' exonuclease